MVTLLRLGCFRGLLPADQSSHKQAEMRQASQYDCLLLQNIILQTWHVIQEWWIDYLVHSVLAPACEAGVPALLA